MLVALAVLIAPAVACIQLGRQSFWFDEAFSVDLAKMPASSFWNTIVHKEANQSLYFVLLRYWPGLGHGEWGARSLSVLCTFLASVCLYALVRQLSTRLHATLSTIVFGLLPFSVQASQEARGFSMLMLVSLASFYTLIRGFSSRNWWPAYAVCTAALPYTHLFGIFIVVAQLLSVVLVHRLSRDYAISCFTGLILATPMFLFFVDNRSVHQLKFLHAPSWRQARVDVSAFGTSLTLGLALLVLALIGATILLKRNRALGTVLATWFTVPPVISIAWSLFASPIYQVRYLSEITPAIAALVAATFVYLKGRVAIATAALALVGFLSAALPGHFGPLIHEDWRSADRAMAAKLRPGDQVLTAPWYLGPAVSVYSGKSYGEVAANPLERPLAERVWILSISRFAPPDPTGYRLSQTVGFGGDVRLSLYVKPAQ